MAGSAGDAGGYDSRAFVAEFYDFVPAYAGRADRQFYLDQIATAGGPVLELGCGTGRLLIPIAQAGFAIAGVDLSRAMLARCREKLAAQAPAVQKRATLLRCDITSFELAQRFAIAIAPFRCFQHLLTVADQIACLRCVHRQLGPAGRLILDVFQTRAERMHDPAFLREQVEATSVRLPDGRSFDRSFRTSAYHRAEQINDCELIYDVTHPDGRRERLIHAFPLRYFFRYEMEHLLARCGFELVAAYGDYDRSPLEDESPEMIFVAQKNAVAD